MRVNMSDQSFPTHRAASPMNSNKCPLTPISCGVPQTLPRANISAYQTSDTSSFSSSGMDAFVAECHAACVRYADLAESEARVRVDDELVSLRKEVRALKQKLQREEQRSESLSTQLNQIRPKIPKIEPSDRKDPSLSKSQSSNSQAETTTLSSPEQNCETQGGTQPECMCCATRFQVSNPPPPVFVLNPCGHGKFCFRCANNHPTCPFCGKRVERIQAI
eukprot:631526_1